MLTVPTCWPCSKNPVNITTAKGTLTQMVSIVFRRMEVTETDTTNVGKWPWPHTVLCKWFQAGSAHRSVVQLFYVVKKGGIT